MLRAMRGAGVAVDDPYVRKASIFITRCQVVNDGSSNGDLLDLGGFSTRPVIQSKGGPEGVRFVRPNGASTCLGLSSLLVAGAAADDTRVRAALRWLGHHYSLDLHPGMARPREGLYGYYYEFARAMRAVGNDRISDSRGVLHDWRAELKRKLTEQQHANGSWTNPDESPESAGRATTTITSLALLTLDQLRR
jgi:squalene-hopene/tetraprenyl-beta-curcumene cyclase